MNDKTIVIKNLELLKKHTFVYQFKKENIFIFNGLTNAHELFNFTEDLEIPLNCKVGLIECQFTLFDHNNYWADTVIKCVPHNLINQIGNLIPAKMLEKAGLLN